MSKVAPTYRDYTALPDDGKRYELCAGELVEVKRARIVADRASEAFPRWRSRSGRRLRLAATAA